MIRPNGYPLFPHEVVIYKYGNDTHAMNDIDKWCERTFGHVWFDRADSWRSVNNGWQFKNYDDAVMLDLAWGNE